MILAETLSLRSGPYTECRLRKPLRDVRGYGTARNCRLRLALRVGHKLAVRAVE